MILITLVSAAVMIVVSHVTQKPDYRAIRNLTFDTTTEDEKRATRASWSWRELAGSGVALAGIVGAYLYFSG